MIKITRQLATIQRSGALAITGGLCTLATDALDAMAFLLPVVLLVDKWCHRVAMCLAVLPEKHLLYGTICNKITGKIQKHKSPINNLLAAYRHNPRKIKKIPAVVLRSRTRVYKFFIPTRYTNTLLCNNNLTNKRPANRTRHTTFICNRHTRDTDHVAYQTYPPILVYGVLNRSRTSRIRQQR